jgi:uncharacterized iron-regulated protein
MRRAARVFTALALLAAGAATAAPDPSACGRPGQWFAPGGGGLTPTQALAPLASREMVLLGEYHDSVYDHRWQLAMLTTLHALHPDLAIGFEMFPRRVQGALDRWVGGELSEAEFLAQADWDHVWGMDTPLYLPLFRFARARHLPMLALNVDSSLVKRVAAVGQAAIPPGERDGVGQAAAIPASYRDELKAAYAAHAFISGKGISFEHFLEAQQFKDRAMAEAMDGYRRAHPNALVVGIMGSGHLRGGNGVPLQLRDLGRTQVAVLSTWLADQDCGDLGAAYADLLFVVPAPAAVDNSMERLGIALREAPEGLLVEQVTAAGLGEKSGLRPGDLILQAAGRGINQLDSAQVLVRRQPAGTWLPLRVRRGGELVDLVLRFPAEP